MILTEDQSKEFNKLLELSLLVKPYVDIEITGDYVTELSQPPPRKLANQIFFIKAYKFFSDFQAPVAELE